MKLRLVKPHSEEVSQTVTKQNGALVTTDDTKYTPVSVAKDTVSPVVTKIIDIDSRENACVCVIPFDSASVEKNTHTSPSADTYMFFSGDIGDIGDKTILTGVKSVSPRPESLVTEAAPVGDIGDKTPKIIKHDALSHTDRPPLPRHLWQSGIADYGQAWRVWQELRKDYFAAMGKHETGYYINDTVTSGFIE
jgi:hypothetical protein